MIAFLDMENPQTSVEEKRKIPTDVRAKAVLSATSDLFSSIKKLLLKRP